MPVKFSFIGFQDTQNATMEGFRGLTLQASVYLYAHIWSLVKAYCEQLDQTLGVDQQKELSARLDHEALHHIETQAPFSLAEKQFLEHMHKVLRKTIERGASSS